jgi:hypothetical protein
MFLIFPEIKSILPNDKSALLLLGYIAMERKAFQRKTPNLNYERSFD